MTQSALNLASKPKRANSPTSVVVTTFGKVIDIHPERHRVDVTLSSGGILRDVPIVMSHMGSKTGLSYIPSVTLTKNESLIDPITGTEGAVSEQSGVNYQYDTTAPSKDRDTYAIINFIEGNINSPVCVGFYAPLTNEMSFAEVGLLLDRHESDVYKMIDKEGNYEINFPDGSYLRVGEGTVKKTLVGQDFDKLWNPITNDPAKTIHLEHASGTTITISPTGSITLNIVEDHELTISGKSIETILGSKNEDVTGDVIENYESSHDTTVGADRTETIAGDKIVSSTNLTNVVSSTADIQASLVSLTVSQLNVNVSEVTTMNLGVVNIAATVLSLGGAITRLGTAATVEGVPLGTQLKVWLDTHRHPDPITGLTGEPVVPSPIPSATVFVSP